MIKIQEELQKRLQNIIRKSNDQERIIETFTEFDDLKEQIINENIDWIVKNAYENTSKNFNGRIYLNVYTGELIAKSMTSTSYIRDLSVIKIYELSSNWLSNAFIKVNDILYNEEFEILEEKFGEEVDYLNPKQLKEIYVDFDDRLIEYLIWAYRN